jgi:hypothetical protein
MMSATSISRERLDVPDADLQNAASAVREALNVQAARVAASIGSRASALKLLKGRDVLKGTQEGRRGSVIRKRRLNLVVMEATCVVSDDEKEEDIVLLPIRPKRRSGRSNWPKTREERLAMENRKEELRQKRELELLEVARREAGGDAGAVGGGGIGAIGALLGLLDEDAYAPSEDERKSLAALALQVSERLGVPIEQLGPPEATVTCVRDSSDRRRLRAYEEGVAAFAAAELASEGPRVAELAVEHGTAAVEFSIDAESPPMAAGELLSFPLAQPQRTPEGDWRLVLSWQTQRPPRSFPASPPRVPQAHAEEDQAGRRVPVASRVPH